MRLATIFLIASMLQVSAATMAQQVTLKKSDVTLRQLFKEVRKQTGYSVIWGSEEFNANERLFVDFNGSSLQEVFDKVVAGKGYSYLIDEKTIIIESRKVKVNVEPANNVAIIDATGKVVDENGQPISGASVLLKSTGKGTITKSNGTFVLKTIEEGQFLIIKHLGYEPEEIRAKEELGSIKLRLSNNPLDEVRVVAYGLTSNRLTVGNIAGIKADEIEKHPVQNVLAALQGQVPGVNIEMSSGLPGAGVKINVQGLNSLNSASDPLYVIDGVPYISQLSSLGLNRAILGTTDGGNGQGSAPGNPLNYLNPSEIESIEVLKDASATAIYGSRAANGAILITTKKGKIGKSSVEINIQNGWSTVPNKIKLLNTEEYISMRREAFKNSNVVPNAGNAYDILGLYGWNLNRSMDWQEILLGRTAQYLNPQVSISGGNESVQYLIGGGFSRQSTVTMGDFSDKKGNFHINLNTNSHNQKLKTQLSLNSVVDKNQLQAVDLVSAALTLPPTAPDIYTSDGSINWAEDNTGFRTWPTTNPVAYLEKRYQNKAISLISNFNLSYKITENLQFALNSGFNYIQNQEVETNPLTYYAPASRPFYNRSAKYLSSVIKSFTIEPQVHFLKQIGIGRLNALLGFTILNENRDGTSLTGSGHNSDALLFDVRSALNIVADGTEISTYKYNALFGRLNYNIHDKFIFEGSARRDGSSRFGPKNQFHTFYSIGGAWIFSEENLFKDKLKFLTFGKIKASYGSTGNDQIGNQLYLDLYTSNTGQVPYQNSTSFNISQLYNPYLHWELTKKSNIGIDLGFLKNRYIFSINMFRNRTSDLLFGYSLPLTTGFDNILTNLNATIENTGWEFTATSNILVKKIKWSIVANWTLPKSRLVSFENLSTSSFANTYSIGQPVNGRRVYHYLGMNPINGKFVYEDAKGNPTENPNSTFDRTTFLPSQNIGSGSITNSFEYKRLRFSFNLRLINKYTNEYIAYLAAGNPGVLPFNQPVSVLSNRWRVPGDQASIPPFSTTLNSYQTNYINSDAGFVNNWILRFKNISLNYSFSESFLRKIGLEKFNIYANAENITTWSKSRNTGFDPETGYSSMPMLRTVTIGLKGNF